MKKYCQTCQKEFSSKTNSHIYCSAECAQATLPPPRNWRDIMDELRPLLSTSKAVALYGELTFSLDNLEEESRRHEADYEEAIRQANENATVWRVDLDVDGRDYRYRAELRAASLNHAEAIYADLLENPPKEYDMVTLSVDCRVRKQQMLHGDQEYIS